MLLLLLLLLLLLFSVLSFALRVYRDVHKVCTHTETNSMRQTNKSRYAVLLWIKWCNHLSCSTLLCNKNRSTNNITGRIPIVIIGKSRCKLTSLAVKHAAATTSNILFCYFLALHSYECKARKYYVVASSQCYIVMQAWKLPSTTVSTIAVAQFPYLLNQAAVRSGVQVRR